MSPRTLSEPVSPSAERDVVVVDYAGAAAVEETIAPANTTALRNVRMMHVLERIAAALAEAGVPMMALKGAALHLVLYERPDQRPMADLDLLIRPENVDAAVGALEKLGALRREPLFREDFFPRFYYEIQLAIGSVHPVTIDLHVRALRPLRLARLMPEDAFWSGAVSVAHGEATVLVPGPEDMLIHLAAHSAFHGNTEERWLTDIRMWIESRRDTLDWNRFIEQVQRWHLGAAVSNALSAAEARFGPCVPPDVGERLASVPISWRDRVALWHAPRDQVHLTGSAMVNALTTPGWRFRLAYLRHVLLPDRAYMDAWSDRHQCSWRPLAIVMRCLGPLLRRVPWTRASLSGIQVLRSGIHGYGVFATRDIDEGATIARYRGRPIDRDGTYVAFQEDERGRERRYEITGPLRYLNHHCRPNAQLVGFDLVALLPIREGEEITIDYGEDSCRCERAGCPCTEVGDD